MAVSDTTVFCVNRGGCDRTHPWNDRQSISCSFLGQLLELECAGTGPDALGSQWWTVDLRGGLRVSAAAQRSQARLSGGNNRLYIAHILDLQYVNYWFSQ